jgi:hypothetical protein
MFLTFSLIIESATEKMFQFIMTLNSIYNKNCGFIDQKIFLKATDRLEKEKNLLEDAKFVITELFCLPFQSCNL